MQRSTPLVEDLLAAIFVVSRATKRWRGTTERQREKLYDLKERGIAHAYRLNLLEFVELHGRLSLYRGGGYEFHSTLRPRQVSGEIKDLGPQVQFRETMPKGPLEPKYEIAIAFLEALPKVDLRSFLRSTPHRGRCFNCGEAGHTARDCPRPKKNKGGKGDFGE